MLLMWTNEKSDRTVEITDPDLAYRRRSTPGSTAGGGGKTSAAAAPGSGKAAPPEPVQERPMSADEARGFGKDGNGGSDDQPYTPEDVTLREDVWR